MFTYPIFSAGGGISSAFNDYIEGLSPSVWLKFEDDSYASALLDSSGNGYHLGLLSGAKAGTLSDGSLRSGIPAIQLYGGTGTRASHSCYWRNNADADTAVASASGQMVLQYTYLSSGTWSPTHILIGFCQIESGAEYAQVRSTSGTGLHCGRFRGTSSGLADPFATTDVNDGNPHIITVKYLQGTSSTGTDIWVDGTKEGTSGMSQTISNVAKFLILSGRVNSSTSHPDWFTDSVAVWGKDATVPSDAQIVEMHTAFLAET